MEGEEEGEAVVDVYASARGDLLPPSPGPARGAAAEAPALPPARGDGDDAAPPRRGAVVTLYRLAYSVRDWGRWRPLARPLARPPRRCLVGSATGTLRPGRMAALMGSSGVGKTTLLDVISGRKAPGAVEGLVLFDGRVPGGGEVSRDVAYVEQRAALWEAFTVAEMLLFTARLKMPSARHSLPEKAARVEAVIDRLGLRKARQSKLNRVSGGEAKRVSIALALLTDPRVTLFDEPTSGLDSAISLDVMSQVRTLADEGRTVLVAIHQPSGEVFNLFSDLILLSSDAETKAGEVAYWGPAGEGVQGYFAALGCAYDPWTRAASLPEFLLSIVSGGAAGPGAAGLRAAYCGSALCRANEAAAEGLVAALGARAPGASGTGSEAVHANGLLEEVGTLSSFKFRACWRDPHFVVSRVALYLALAVIFVSFFAPGARTPMELATSVAIIFLTVFTQAGLTLLYIPRLKADEPAFFRESHDACYRPFSYAAATAVVELSAVAVSSLGFSSIFYFAVEGFINRSASAFAFYAFTLFLYSSGACLATLAFATPLPSVEVALAATALYQFGNCLLIGFLIPVPAYWAYLSLVAHSFWAFGAFLINQFDGNPIDYAGLCADVPADAMWTLTGSLGADAGALSLDPNALICSAYAGLLRYAEATEGTEGTNATLQDVLVNSGACSGEDGVPDVLSAGAQAVVARHCQPAVGELLFGDLPTPPPAAAEALDDVGVAVLGFFPQGDTFAATPKFAGRTRGECLGALAGLFLLSFLALWGATRLSIRLVKR